MKKKWGILNEIYNAVILHKYPVYLIQFVTERCNAKCPHCFVNFKTEEDELKLEQIETISKTSGKYLRNIALTGGEPFIRDDLFEIANIWWKNSSVQSISITTNGSMPDKINNFSKQAVAYNMPVSFFFSYDFIEEKHSNYRRLKDLHIKVKESYNIVKSLGNNLNATFSITLTPENVDSAFETYVYMRDVLKIQNINCAMIRGKNADIIDTETRNKLAYLYKKIQTQRNIDFDNGTIKGFNNNSLTSIILNAKNKMLWKYILKTFVEKKYISPCNAGSLFGIIYSNGDVAPCELLYDKAGNLKDFNYDFMKCWTSQKSDIIRKNIKCSKCFCTFECSWLINIFSSPRYFPEIAYNILKNTIRDNNNDK